MNCRRFGFHLILALGLPWIISCGKNLSQIFFHDSVDRRAAQSLSGELPAHSTISPTDPDRFSFAVFGDIQIHEDGVTLLPRLKADVAANQISFFVALGDLTEDGTEAEFEQVKAAMDGVGIPYLATIGNHDLFQDPAQGGWGTWKSIFGAATYSVTVANAVRFLFLDTASGDIGQSQFDWLQRELATRIPITFVASHYPIYDGVTPIIWRLSSLEERYKLTSILDQGGIFAYLAGHIHGYKENRVARFKHFIAGSMFPKKLDYGLHGYLLFTYDHGQMSWKQVTWSDLP